MTESGPSGAPPGFDPEAPVDVLRARGAERFDPVGFRFIEALARRAAGQGAEVAGILERRLAKALADYGERFEHAEREARDALLRATAQFPDAADDLRRRWEAGDFGGLQRLLARLQARGDSRPLAELLAHVARHTPQSEPSGSVDAAGGAQGELKSLAYFRRTWSRLGVERQLSRARAQAPENAGPLNSHFLVLQSLERMRDISPDYLEQFMAYAEALLWLDQADGGRGPAPKNTLRGERDKKRKPARGSGG